jgi:hypothetical protein
MQFLWLLTFVVRKRYGNRFFGRALEDSVTEICASLVTRDIMATALFFASVAANDLGDETPFKVLLEEFKPAQLPITVSLAIEGESKEFDKTRMTVALKTFGKKLSQWLKSTSTAISNWQAYFVHLSDRRQEGRASGMTQRRLRRNVQGEQRGRRADHVKQMGPKAHVPN